MGVISTQVTHRTDGRPMPSNHRRNAFKQRDVVRAMRSAEAAGFAVGGVEVVTRDGTTIRVLAKDAAKLANSGSDLDHWIEMRGKNAGET